MNQQVIAPFAPHGWQIAPWRDKSQVVLLTGSAGGGKSRLACEKVHAFCKKYPEATVVAVRKTRESMTSSTVLFMERTVIGNDPNVRHYASKHRFEYKNGSILAYGGMADEQQREQIRSIGSKGGVDMALFEEANKFVRDDFNEMLARMRGPAADWTQIILATNPDYPEHWIYTDLIVGGGAKVYYSSAADNPANPDNYEWILDQLTGVMRARLKEGRWIRAEGAVYDEFDPLVHVIDPFPIPTDWRRIRVVDFGYTNPFVCQWWAIDPDGRMYLYREIYMSQRIVLDHTADILRLSDGEYIEATPADHDAEDRATMDRFGILTIPAIKEVSPGIQAVQERLRIAGDGKPRLYIMRNALVETDKRLTALKKPTCTESEIPAYSWQQSVDGKPIKEEPVKKDDHGMDAMRYAVTYIDGIQLTRPTQFATVIQRLPVKPVPSLSDLIHQPPRRTMVAKKRAL